MTTLQKVIKYLSIIFGIFLIFVIISSILGIGYTVNKILSPNKYDDIKEEITNVIDDIKDSATVNIASSYCYDIYKYLKSGYKKFTMHNDFKPVPAFTYEMLDLLENVNVDDILKKKTSTQRDNKLYYIYHGDYLSNKNNKRNCKDFFIWLVENKCGYIDDYITSLSTITDFKDINPFTNDYYIFYPIEYLINEGKIKQNPYMNIYSRDEIANDINKFINKRIQRFRVNNDDSYKRKNKFALNEGKLSLLYLYD